MKNLKDSRLFALALAFIVGAIVSLPAFATDQADSPGELSSAVDLSAEAATFSVAVPTRLTIDIAADGTVTTANNAAIVNNSNGPVKVSAISVQPKNGWALAAWGKDFRGTPTGTKEFTMQINEAAVDESGAVQMADTQVIRGGDRLALNYAADAAVQAHAVSEEIAEIIITVDWDESATAAIESPEAEAEANNTIAFTLDSVSYQAEPVMTWMDWFKSGYNTHGLSKTTPIYNGDLSPINLSNVIEADAAYHTMIPMHSGGSNN